MKNSFMRGYGVEHNTLRIGASNTKTPQKKGCYKTATVSYQETIIV
jgi:hypothetical protein